MSFFFLYRIFVHPAKLLYQVTKKVLVQRNLCLPSQIYWVMMYKAHHRNLNVRNYCMYNAVVLLVSPTAVFSFAKQCSAIRLQGEQDYYVSYAVLLLDLTTFLDWNWNEFLSLLKLQVTVFSSFGLILYEVQYY